MPIVEHLSPPAPPDAPRPAAVAWAWVRVLLAVPWYAAGYVPVACVALVWYAGRAAWRDMRRFTGEVE